MSSASEMSNTLVCGIVCRKCGNTLPPHTMEQHLKGDFNQTCPHRNVSNNEVELLKNNFSILKQYCLSRGMIHDIMKFVKYAHLPTKDVEYLTTWGSSEWMNYLNMREMEYFCNRETADIPLKKRKENEDDYNEDDREILTMKMFKKLNYVKKFTYKLYKTLSEADQMSCEKFNERVEILLN